MSERERERETSIIKFIRCVLLHEITIGVCVLLVQCIEERSSNAFEYDDNGQKRITYVMTDQKSEIFFFFCLEKILY